MEKLLLPVAFLLLVNVVAFGQASESPMNEKAKFSSIAAIGLMTGSDGEALIVETITGVKKSKWFAGVGTGIDYYFYRSVPLFVNVQRELLSGKNTPFVYAGSGINFPWLTNDQKNLKGGPTSYGSGLYYDAGIGWKLKGKYDRAFLFSAGFNFKQVKEVVNSNWWFGPQPGVQEYVSRYDNRLHRIVIKIGCQL